MRTFFEEHISPTEYMRRVGASDIGRSYKNLVQNEMLLRPGARVLDLGSGPGTDLCSYAEAVGITGGVIAVDHDPTAVQEATAATAHLSQVEVLIADAHDLDLPDASFDVVHTDRLLQHVRDPTTVLIEMARVLRPGGIAVFAEPDWRTLVVDHPEPALVEAYTTYVIRHQVRHARIGSQLPRLSQDAGLRLDRVIPVTAVYTEAHAADQVLGLHRVTQRAVEHGHMTAAESHRWLQHLQTEGGSFFAATTLYITVAHLPAPASQGSGGPSA